MSINKWLINKYTIIQKYKLDNSLNFIYCGKLWDLNFFHTFIQDIVRLSDAVESIWPLERSFLRGALWVGVKIVYHIKLSTAVPDNKITLLLKTVRKLSPVSWKWMLSHPVLDVSLQFLYIVSQLRHSRGVAIL